MCNRLLFVLTLTSCAACAPRSLPETDTSAVRHDARAASRPVVFEQNNGQAPQPYRYLVRAPSYDLGFTTDEVAIALKDSAGVSHLTLRFVDGSMSAVSGDGPLAGHVNYFHGRDPRAWHPRVPTYDRVRYARLYDGIDAVFYASDQVIEYDLVVAPHANPNLVALRFDGADRIDVGPAGELHVHAAGRELVQHKPIAYQTKGSTRTPIAASYRVADDRVGVALADYDPALPLTIDPIIAGSIGSRCRRADIFHRAGSLTTDTTILPACANPPRR